MNRFFLLSILAILFIFPACSSAPQKPITQNSQSHPGEENTLGEKQNGIQTRWYENGSKAEEVELKNGLKNGRYSSWYENGQLKLKCGFNNNELNGDFEAWFEDGRKRLSVFFIDGKRDGKWARYHEKRDRVVAEMNYKNNKLDGVLTAAFDQGNGNGFGRSFSIKSVFKDGALVDLFYISYTNIYGHTFMARGKILGTGDLYFDQLKNIKQAANGELKVDYGDYETSYDRLRDFFASEIDRHVFSKFSLEFCDNEENLWPCQFSPSAI